MTTEPYHPLRQDLPGESRPDSAYAAIFERLPFAAWVLDRATLRILAANQRSRAFYGYADADLVGMTYPQLCGPEDVLDVRQKLGHRARSRGVAAWWQKRRSGEMVLTEIAWVPVPFERVPAFLMFHYPSHSGDGLAYEASQNRAQLEAVTSRLVQIQEEERGSIARELHDEIGQLLTALKIHLASGGISAPSEAKEILDELIGRVRDLSMDLRPPMLEEMGLVVTLEWYFGRYTKRTNVAVRFRQDLERGRFQDRIELAAFRIIQEALTNVARHSGTHSADVDLRADPEGLWIVIEDRGPGFDPSAVRSGISAGIAGMQERARLVGGHFTLESAVGVGTRIAVVLPLPESDSDRQESGS